MLKTMYKEVEIEIDVDLSDFDTDDLLEELESRGELPSEQEDSRAILESIWLKRRLGRTDYEAELDQLIYAGLGKVI